MQTQAVKLDRNEAARLYREYQKHRHWSQPIDDEIRRAYKAIAEGKTVIRALESVTRAGLNEQGLPRLALGWAMAPAVRCFIRNDGQCEMHTDGMHTPVIGSEQWRATRNYIQFPRGSFPDAAEKVRRYSSRGLALLPPIPLHLRPKRGLANYHLLWEAEWEPVPPGDPMLLRRIGKGDLWLVVAAWDLTPVEQAALAARI